MNIRFTIVTSIGWACLAVPCFAQAVAAPAQPGVEKTPAAEVELSAAIKKRIDTYVERQQMQIEKQFALTFANIQQVCDLDAEQTKKLRIASKGAIDRLLGNYRKQMEQTYKARAARPANLQARAAAVAAPARAIAAPQAANPFGGANPFAARAVTITSSASSTTITDEPIWKNALNKVLTAEQNQALETSVAQRDQFRRKMLVESAIAILDEQFILTTEQREELGDLIDQAITDRPITAPANWNFYTATTRTVIPMLCQSSQDKVAKILNVPQAAAWREYAARFGAVRLPAAQLR